MKLMIRHWTLDLKALQLGYALGFINIKCSRVYLCPVSHSPMIIHLGWPESLSAGKG